ncbi:MAG: hypothetical protein KBI47_22365 [Armatimonadetes bacterium]|nr:hypothetical protein [Armatimonadota bacterium]MDI9586168.1 hypothetical protein [Acidobacteriota bacterium]
MSRHNRLSPVLLASTAALLSGIGAAVAADLVLVDGGTARSVVVTADKPSPLATYAAGELVAHVEKATGERLEVVGESDAPAGATRVYIGDTQAARRAGLDPDGLPGETYRIMALDGNLYILGREDGQELFAEGDRQNAITRDTPRGTFYGVCEFLDRFLGVRWLWPGELGTYVPRKSTLTVDADLDVTKGPAFAQRRYRIGRITSTMAAGQYPSDCV